MKQKKYLIIRLSSIGDVLHATTVARNLKKSDPYCHITWMVSRTASELLQDNPDIDEVFIWSREDFEKALHGKKLKAALHTISLLREFYASHGFDAVIDIHGLFMTGVITWMSGCQRKIGMYGTRELNWLFMNERSVPASEDIHVIKRYLSVLPLLQGKIYDYEMTLQLPVYLEAFGISLFQEHQIDRNKPVLLVNPWTSWASKNWGTKNFIQCLRLLPPGIQIILCGGPADRAKNKQIASEINRPITDLTGKTTLSELARVVQMSDLLLTGDTGTLHIAIALHIPTLSLWGPSAPEKYGPLVPGHIVVKSKHACIACDKTKCRLKTNACMEAIDPAGISKKIEQFFTDKKIQ